jgi:dolichol-phosphate mannosyltransferase
VAVTARETISFVVPCFNEEDNVVATVEAIREAVPKQNDYEVILVDDCSRDRTLERMQALADIEPRLRVVHNPVNLGLGGSYKRGVAMAQGQYVIMIPGDNGFPTESIGEILRHAGQADIVIPVVTNPGARTRFRAFASRCFTLLLNWVFWLDIGYYNGAVLHRTGLLRAIEIKTNGFAYQAEALVKLIARGASYTQCHVPIQERATGRSSALSRRNQIAVWKTIFHLLGSVGVFRKGWAPRACRPEPLSRVPRGHQDEHDRYRR